MINFFKSGLRGLIDKKPYLELVVALLTIPFLVILILVNFRNFDKNGDNGSANNSPTIVNDSEGPAADVPPVSQLSTPNPEVCEKEVGPISIISPREGADVDDNPVNFIIRYEDGDYCSVVWSYRINSGQWSEYSQNSPAIYNMPQGKVTFELRVQSTVSNDQEILERNFVYKGIITSPSPTPSTE